MGLFGDPRLYSSRWTRMQDAEAIVRRWLVQASLRQFLDVIDHVTPEGDEKRMFKYRRLFWEAVYRAELISDAWVVFDGKANRFAKRSFGNELSFASFQSVKPGQAVLLLRVGRGLVAEWSYSGRCFIWNDAEARDAPRMYRRAYGVSELQCKTATDGLDKAVFAVRHIHPETGYWQSKAAAKIQQMTGVRIAQSEYRLI
jgi:hypothetical protein